MVDSGLLFVLWIVNTMTVFIAATLIVIYTLDELMVLIMALSPLILTVDSVLWGVWRGSR